MDQNQEKRSLGDLPPSSDSFWNGHVEARDMNAKKLHEHNFVRESSRDIRCGCGFGLFIEEGDELKDGHLYHYGEFIV